MNLIILAALVAACGADKLDRTYLPPASAKTAGGSPGALQAPNSFSQSTAPKGSYTNDFQGVVVDAALAGTRASGSEETGLGGPRNSYGSTASKVGDAAFRRSQGGFRFPVGTPNNFETQFGDSRPENQFGGETAPEIRFGAPKDSTPERTQVFGVSAPERTQTFEVSRPERPQAAQERAASTLRFENEVGVEGFNYAFETDNGISAEETAVATDGVQAQGAFSYTGDDGKVYSVTYTADEGGYKPRGLYDAQKYNEGGDYTESDSVNGKLNGRPSVNTGNSDVDASGTFINQNNLPFSPNSNQRGSDNRAPVNRVQSISNGNGKAQSNSATGNRFGSRNEYLPPFNNQNKPQSLRPQAPTVNAQTPDADPSSTFQQESTEEGSGGFHSNSEHNQAPMHPGSSSINSRPAFENKFNTFKQNGSPTRNQFNKNVNRSPSSQSNRQQFGEAPVNTASHSGLNQFSPQSGPSSLHSQKSTSVPDTELSTPFESNPNQDAVQPAFGFRGQPTRPGQQLGFQSAQNEASPAPAKPTIPAFTQSRPQASNRPIGGNRNTQSTFSTQAPQEQQEQFNQQSQFQNSRPQFSQGQFSQNFDSQYAPSTQKPQFAQQNNVQDDSYYYNQPSKTFNTPQTQGSRFPSAPSNQFDRVTQRPSFLPQTTQHSEEPNYPSTLFPSQNGQRQGSTRRPRPPTIPTEPTPSVNQYQSNAISSTNNGITQASASSFAAPTSPTGFSRQQFSQRQQYQQSSFQSNQPSMEPQKTSFGIQTTAQKQPSRTQSQFEQQNFEKAQPLSQQPLQDVKQPKLDDDVVEDAPAVINQQYQGELYEYTKPAEMVPPPEDGFGQFGVKVQTSQSTQTRPQFSQNTASESQQPTSGPSFSSPQPSRFDQTATQDDQFNPRPQFGQTSVSQPEKPTSRPSFGSSKPSSSQTTKAPQGDQFGAQTAEQEQSTDDFNAQPSRKPFSQQSQSQQTENQQVNNQFGGQRRPFSSQSQNSFSGSTAESPRSFGGQNGRPSCCRATFGQQQNFAQGSRPSQFGRESQFSQSSFQGGSGFKPDQTQSVAGKGEIFGGPRKPPSFDDTGYHY
ncbi:hypothetical protein MSG28_008926 [Choristoneura fumiferana]|uniref:Uncharacterized protein n=1 Tax=Choristoneura fumiferana TaxID=7141 RepID=A0ACC0J8M0_CHOFU|nr:hypothetical protein MSG28_008926 [Choristoneura fumiferana]